MGAIHRWYPHQDRQAYDVVRQWDRMPHIVSPLLTTSISLSRDRSAPSVFSRSAPPYALAAEVNGGDTVECQTLLALTKGCDAQEHGPITDQGRTQAEPEPRLATGVW